MASILFGDLMRVSGSLCISERWSLCTSHGMTASGQLRCSLPLIKCSASSENTAGNSLEPSACCSSFTASPCKVGLYYSWRDAAICYKPKVACPPPPCPLISSLGGPLLILNTSGLFGGGALRCDTPLWGPLLLSPMQHHLSTWGPGSPDHEKRLFHPGTKVCAASPSLQKNDV
ncbi:PREDICTED: uncharacterized protein LOC105580708 isoform X6 [Cercocebus atys]|uniref:uncharacterized protein LOC105580708 isoform X6 n=1 Tax=Cercocebus atys TaxID=9531 RepID=UPI0005F507F9|nr:PREDICTED: uncharacterized protein LOC105580708 isoform X6 [Cercocebus atys]